MSEKKKIKREFAMDSPEERAMCVEFILNEVPLNEGVWVMVSSTVKDKTLRQLGGCLGVWVKEESQRTGYPESYIHRMWKAKFLARIYAREPMSPEQESWVELLIIYQQGDDRKKFERHAKRISLSWAKLPQMRDYMDQIEAHHIDEGRPLPILDPERRKLR